MLCKKDLILFADYKLTGFHIFSGSGRSRSISCGVEGSQHVHLTSRKHRENKTGNNRPLCQPPRGIQDVKGNNSGAETCLCGYPTLKL